MIARLQNPMVSGLLGLLLSIGIGLTASWRTLNTMVTHAIQLRAHKPQTEFQKKGWDFWTVEMENLATEMNENRSILRKREEELANREQRIAAAEKELAKARADIDAMRKEISERIVEVSADEIANLRKLSQTYSNQTPRSVVAIIREMDDTTAVKILSLMKSDVVGPIFEEMTKNAGADGPLARRAAVLTEKLRLVKAAKSATPQ